MILFQNLFVSLQMVRGEIRTNDALLIDTHLTERCLENSILG